MNSIELARRVANRARIEDAFGEIRSLMQKRSWSVQDINDFKYAVVALTWKDKERGEKMLNAYTSLKEVLGKISQRSPGIRKMLQELYVSQYEENARMQSSSFARNPIPQGHNVETVIEVDNYLDTYHAPKMVEGLLETNLGLKVPLSPLRLSTDSWENALVKALAKGAVLKDGFYSSYEFRPDIARKVLDILHDLAISILHSHLKAYLKGILR